MPKLHCLLIGAPGSGAHHLQGVKVDIQKFGHFLVDIAGGAWRPDEIQILNSPSRSDLLSALNRRDNYDYTVTYFSGHGGRNRNNDEDFVWINDRETVTIRKLMNESPRQLIITDACRTYADTSILQEDRALVKAFAKAGPSAEQARAVFAAALLRCEEGVIIAHATGPNQAAAEDPKGGGYFTQGLLSVVGSRSASFNLSSRTVSIQTAFDIAVTHVKSKTARQNPELVGHRRRNWFPFYLLGTYGPVDRLRVYQKMGHTGSYR